MPAPTCLSPNTSSIPFTSDGRVEAVRGARGAKEFSCGTCASWVCSSGHQRLVFARQGIESECCGTQEGAATLKVLGD